MNPRDIAGERKKKKKKKHLSKDDPLFIFLYFGLVSKDLNKIHMI